MGLFDSHPSRDMERLTELIQDVMCPFRTRAICVRVPSSWDVFKVVLDVDILPSFHFEITPAAADYSIVPAIAEEFAKMFRAIREPIGDHITLGEE